MKRRHLGFLNTDRCSELAEANFDNHVAALDYRNRVFVDKYRGGEFVRSTDGQCRVHWCRLGDGVFNIVYGALLAAEDSRLSPKERVADVTARTADQWHEPVRWFVSSKDQPKRLGLLLEAAGWVCDYHWTEMALPLGKALRSSSQPTIEIVPVQGEFDRLDWMNVQCAGYDLDHKQARFMDQLSFAFLSQRRRRFQLFLARTDSGDAAATAAIFKEHGSAGIYMVATHPQFRRRGIATELMNHLIGSARDSGCSKAVLQASDQACSLYRALGFVECGRTAIYSR